MSYSYSQIAPAGLLQAVDAAVRAIPPAFPLDATVAVNPYLGQSGQSLAQTAARLARVAGVRMTPQRATYAARIAQGEITDDDLAEALWASSEPCKPVDLADLRLRIGIATAAPQPFPTVADLVAGATGTDWPGVLARCFGQWAAGHFDRGQALWLPRPGRGAYAAWREWATHDLTPEIAGLAGFCAHVADAPDTAERAILRASDRLGLTQAAAETAYHRLLADLGGWAQHARWLLWQAELRGDRDTTLADLLAIRLVWEEALLAHCPAVSGHWAEVVAAHAAPVDATKDQVIDAILQDAAERAFQRRLMDLVSAPGERAGRPRIQAAFCIDVRSEVLRRAFEAQDPAIETLGFAGFFGLPLAFRQHGTDDIQSHLPALLVPSMVATDHLPPAEEAAGRIEARSRRAWGRFRQAAVSSLAFVEAAGPAYGVKLVKQALGLGKDGAAPTPIPRFETGLTAAQKTATALAVLRAMSLTTGFARLVLLVGHGAGMTNNPHQSAYRCGACCGQTGEVSARVLADLLNDPETRAGLVAEGLSIPADTVFMAGLHDTVTDDVTLFVDAVVDGHADDIAQARKWLGQAGRIARAERAPRLPGAKGDTIARRAADWAEVRPEWGLAGCAAFVAAPRNVTAKSNLQGRAFLHSYDWQADKGFGTLELILTAPVVVASWISLQYYGSAVAPEVFGGGNKLIHNVVGGVGVVEGNGGILRAGLPWQAVSDGERLAHEPLRLSVMVQAPTAAIADVLRRHDGVRDLFDNGWLHLFALEEGRVVARYRPGLVWEDVRQVAKAA